MYLDGARLANAAVALGVPLAELAAPADTVAFSLNKGLCAPVGSVLAGDAPTIATEGRLLRRIGAATIHKAGILAAAGILALELIDRLADDHRRARRLAELLGLAVPETNLVLSDLPATALPQLADHGVLALAPPAPGCDLSPIAGSVTPRSRQPPRPPARSRPRRRPGGYDEGSSTA